MSPEHEREVIEGLLRLADRCSEALANMVDDKEIDDQHVDNLSEINREVWRIRWEIGLLGGHTEIAPPFVEPPTESETVE
ncbi:MAG TPA: hypothetical protein VJN18_14510 [Polyangiaceae bacterium]|nr:hypothetical protein [Polyangiaceae bacterium]